MNARSPRPIVAIFVTLLAIPFAPPLICDLAWCAGAQRRSAGNIHWIYKYALSRGESDPDPQAVAVDRDGAVYVAGFIQTQDSDVDFLTLKLDPKGRLLWKKRYNGPANDVDRARAIAVDRSGNVIVAGDSDKGTGKTPSRLAGLDFAAVKYSANGERLWVCRYNSPSDGEDRPAAMAVDPSGAAVLVGKCKASFRLRSGKQIVRDLFTIVKISREGRVAWSRHIVSPEGGNSEATAVATDTEGNIYATGFLDSPARGLVRDSDIVTVKYSPAGLKLWERRYGTRGQDRARGIALDSRGRVYVGGEGWSTQHGAAKEDLLLLRYSGNGTLAWARGADSGSRFPEEQSGFAVDEEGRSWVSGLTRRFGEESPVWFVASFDAEGRRLWTHTPDDSREVGGSRIVALGRGEAAVGFSARSNGGSGDIWAVKYDRRGRVRWIAPGDGRRHDGPAFNDELSGLALAPRGDVIATGKATLSPNGLMVIGYRTK